MKEKSFTPDKSKLRDPLGRMLTQSLFLEPVYNTEYAMYTLTSDEDKEYQGKIYPSLKRLYLAMSDPVEYEFASTYLLGWPHWQRLCENAIIRKHIDEWRLELELKLASEGFRMILDQSEDNYQASKWLAERGWAKRGAGRPKKEEIERERKISDKLEEEFSADIVRLSEWK